MIEENVDLAPLTTFRIGGAARFFVRAKSAGELTEALAFAAQKELKIFLLGGGSNVLFRDEGFDGLVIKIEITGVERQDNSYTVGAGENWDAFAERTAADGLWGVENLSGIPGTVGGAVVQNIGAYGAALSQTLLQVEALDTQTGKVVALRADECAFGYRTSIFKDSAKTSPYIILRATFRLSEHARPNVEYKDLAQRFAAQAPGLADIRRAVIDIRSKKFPDLTQEGTAGSFFLNPVVPQAQAQALKARYPQMPLFDMPESDGVKVPLGWILDHVLNLRGFAMGKARLFERQALVVAAARGAHAAEVRALAEFVKREVREKIKMEISEEVRLV